MTETAKAVKLSMYSKLADVMGLVERVPKTGHNKFHGYDYATEADITGAVRKAMADRKLVMVPNVIKSEWADVLTSSNKKERLCTLTVRFDVHDGESGESMSFEVLGQGQDGGDKATYKAMTGAVKYALLKLFLIPTGDDPENEEAPAGNKPPSPAGVAALKQRVATPPPPAARQSPPSGPPEPPPHGEDMPSAPGPRPEAIAFRFGASKGKTSHDVTEKDLNFYIGAAQKSVDDPEKERFLAANTRELAVLQSELRWRAGR